MALLFSSQCFHFLDYKLALKERKWDECLFEHNVSQPLGPRRVNVAAKQPSDPPHIVFCPRDGISAARGGSRDGNFGGPRAPQSEG